MTIYLWSDADLWVHDVVWLLTLAIAAVTIQLVGWLFNDKSPLMASSLLIGWAVALAINAVSHGYLTGAYYAQDFEAVKYGIHLDAVRAVGAVTDENKSASGQGTSQSVQPGTAGQR